MSPVGSSRSASRRSRRSWAWSCRASATSTRSRVQMIRRPKAFVLEDMALRVETGYDGGLFDVALPEPLRDLPADLAAIDELLRDDAMLAPFREHWDHEVKAGLIGSSRWGRPTIPMATYVRLIMLKHRYRWGYEVLVREVADSLHLRRFCGIALHHDAPDESTVRKMTRRLGHEVVDELVRALVEQPTRAQVRAVVELAQFTARAEQLAEQVRRRVAGEPIGDRLVSVFDIHARPIRKGKLGVPTQFGYLLQLTELTPTTQRGARGLLLPPTLHVGNPPENVLLPDTVAELGKVDASPKVAAFDGGFTLNATS